MDVVVVSKEAKPLDAMSKENVESKCDVKFTVIYNKKKYDVNLPLDSTISVLKAYLQSLIGIPPAMMKVMVKGLAKDEFSLRSLGVKSGTKIMVVGSSLNDVYQMSSPTVESRSTENANNTEATTKVSLSQQKIHKKILDRGKPDNVMQAYLGTKSPLPSQPLSGMLNKYGGKVRLTFKLDKDQIWIGTKERTEKVNIASIKNIVSEPIDDHPEYHMLAFQLGPTEASRYWIYWVPCQHVEAIKDSILGKWQLF